MSHKARPGCFAHITHKIISECYVDTNAKPMINMQWKRVREFHIRLSQSNMLWFQRGWLHRLIYLTTCPQLVELFGDH